MISRHEIKAYLKQIKKELTCSNSLKNVFLNDFNNQIKSFVYDNDTYTMNDITNHFGTPKEIAYSFENHKDLQFYKRIAKRYKITKIIVLSLVSLFILSFLILVIIIKTETEGIDWSWFRGGNK